MLKFSTILRLASFWHSCLARKARQGLVTLRESWMSFANFFNLWYLQRTSVIQSKKSIHTPTSGSSYLLKVYIG